MEFSASFFDGKSSQGVPVFISRLYDGSLRVRDMSRCEHSIASDDYTYTPPVGKSPIRIRIKSSGGLIESQYSDALRQLMEQNTARHSQWILRAESHIGMTAGLSILALFVSVFLYLYALPLAGILGAPLIPHSVKDLAGTQILSALDALLLHPSVLDQEKQKEAQMLAINLQKASGFAHPLEFHLRRFDDKNDVANAFAILPRTIIVTDELIKSLTPEEVQGVIAHEFGHLQYDHGTQMLIRSSAVSLLTIALFGSDPGAIQGMALAVLESSYSQDQERSADLYAVELLKKIGADPHSLADALEKMSKNEVESDIYSYISTHPLTSERIAYINSFAGKRNVIR